MGKLYKENKNFANKFSSIIVSSMSERIITLSSRVPFKDGLRINISIRTQLVKPVEFLENSKNLYFCIRVKETERYIGGEYINQGDIDKMSLSIFRDNISYMNKERTDEIRDYLTSKGKNISPSLSDLVYDLRYGKHDDVMKDFHRVITIKKYIQSLQKCNVNITRNPEVFKSLKGFDVFPIAILGDDNSFKVPMKSSNVRTNTNIFDIATVEHFSTQNLKSNMSYVLRYLPVPKWAILDIEDPEIDKKFYMNYNYNL